MKKPIISISLVVWNGRQYLPQCLESIANQDLQDFELLILDNGSADGTRDFLERLGPEKYHIRTIEYLPKNIGFAAGHNSLFRQARGEFVLCLNQDVELEKNYLSEIVAFMKKNPRTGSAAGILWRSENGEKIIDPSTAFRVDSAGLKIFRNRRIAEIGVAEERPKEVFGVSAAAAVYRMTALKDVAEKENGRECFFDEIFFSYKEDVDLAWRLRHRGWQSFILPVSGSHIRSAKAEGDSQIKAIFGRAKKSALANFHSQKNHLFVLVKNDFFANAVIDIIHILWYELRKFIYVILFEWRTIPAYFIFIGKLPKMLIKRRKIMERTIAKAPEIRIWFVK
ncbi:glycosyltransferase family 2 protein [Patescibacteria group bacterium]|nr:MAG: glycosyltransferase family 2 protein [Patescibacteria group bacterium]